VESSWTRKRHGSNRLANNDGDEIGENSLAIGERFRTIWPGE